MALSLALNWSPPPSSPLFDDGLTQGTPGEGGDTLNNNKQLGYSASSPRPSSGPSSTSSITSDMDRRRKAEQQSMPSSSSSSNGISIAQSPSNRSNSMSPQSRTYASAVSQSQASRSASIQQADMPGVPRPTMSHSTSSNKSSFSGNGPYQSFQQSNNKIDHLHQMAITEDGRRTRTTSGPHKSSQITYNDTLQHQHHHPGIVPSVSTQSFRSGYGLPAGAMSPVTPSHPALQLANINSGTNGYHPYRRAHKGSEVNNSNQSAVSQLPSSQGFMQPALPTAAAAPVFNPRIRSISTSSSNANREVTGRASPSPLSSSFATSTQMHNQQTNNSQQQVGLGHLRHSPQLRPTIPASASRSEISSRGYSSAMPPPPPPIASSRPPHSRSNSGSSSQSATEGSYISTHSASSSGRNTPNSSAKKPSPLSRAAAAAVSPHLDNDGDNGAVYGGSDDDEDTIRGRSTPTPDDKARKGLSSKLRKALSFSTLSDIQQAEAAAAAPDRAYGGRNNLGYKRFEGNSTETNGSSGSTRSTSPPQTPDNGAPPMHTSASSAASISSRRSMRPPISNPDGMAGRRGLFNRKFNSSTDNISISSTVSSASVMLRKVGNLGKFAKRSSLMGLTNMFNKDKDTGKEGNQKDDFGAHVSPDSIVAADDATLSAGGKKDKSKPRKGTPATASVSHATVELESSGGAINDKSMTPAASYVRQHQLQMKQQAEAERFALEKQEAERAAMDKSKSNNNNTRTTDDVMESRQKMIEKEKERLKNKRGWRKKFSMGSTSEAKQTTGLETMPVIHSAQENSLSSSNGYQQGGSRFDTGRNIEHNSSSAAYLDTNADNSYESEELMPPQMPGAMLEGGYESSGDEFETDSLRHWGEGIERSRESAAKIKQVKGILKNTNNRMTERSSSGHSSPPLSHSANSIDRPFAHRNRANSYDAPQASNHPSGSIPSMSQMSTTPAGSDRVDGMARANTSEDSTSQDYRSAIGSPTISSSNMSPTNSSSQFGHHANSSMPTLSLVMNPNSSVTNRSMMTPSTRKQLVFADTQIYHSTWPAHIYDRRGELATCNCLTPLLAQRIKEELNTYKMEEMAVAPSSRIHTHFFV